MSRPPTPGVVLTVHPPERRRAREFVNAAAGC
jgi:hypothetical protein